jgi:hypothetical protein
MVEQYHRSLYGVRIPYEQAPIWWNNTIGASTVSEYHMSRLPYGGTIP